jgi:ABC-type transporter Mla subunit MlaD
MVVVPLSKPENESPTTPDPIAPGIVESEAMNWISFAAGGTLVAGGLLLLAGERRAGMVAAASGTALALLDQQDTLHNWWDALPGYIDQVQNVLGRVQDTVNEAAAKREQLRRILAR